MRKRAVWYRQKPQVVRRDGRLVVEAMHEGHCEVCDRAILQGTWIVRDSFGQWVHVTCR